MALKLTFASETALLAAGLAQELRDISAGSDPLTGFDILVPNRNLEKWLRFELARDNGVSANLRFPYLERGLWNLVGDIGVATGCVPADDARRPAVVETENATTASRIAACLLRDAGNPDLAESPLLAYCRAGGGPGEPGFAIRLWQMAGRFAELFREYEFSRTSMVRGWLGGDAVVTSPVAQDQARIYRDVFGDPGIWDNGSGMPDRSLFQLAETVFPDRGQLVRQAFPDIPAVPANAVFVFGMSSLSPYHCRLLYEIARHRNVHIFHLNTCHEFWEDVSTPFEDRWRRIRETPVSADDGEIDLVSGLDENPLLKAWGKAGRETVKILADLDDQSGGVDISWVDDGPDAEPRPGWSVLDRVRYGIRNRTSNLGRASQDDSLVVMNCPGPEREVESVYDQIVDLMRRDPGLRLSDVAVLVADMATYKPFITAVFERDEFPVPYNLADSSAASDSMYGAAVNGLLGLIDSDFSRRAVFELFRNPCFMEGVGIDVDDVDTWMNWAVRLGVYHDFKAEGGPGGGVPDAFTWSQALRRIRLGRVMSRRDDVPADEHDGVEGVFSGVFPYRDGDTDDRVADRFCETVELLAVRIMALKDGDRGPAVWRRQLASLFDEFLAIPDDRPGEHAVRRALLDGLDLYFNDGAGLGAALRTVGLADSLGPAMAVEIVRGLLSGIPTGRGRYLSNGVTIASLKPMRPIPFKVVFVMGLQEGGFPGTKRESSLDLRLGMRRVGDVTIPDTGRYMFLETLLNTRTSLRLSYDGWDTRKDEVHEPCSVVRQLVGHVCESILEPGRDGATAAFDELRVPLSPCGVARPGAAGPVPERSRRMKDRVVSAALQASMAGRLDDLRAAAVSASALARQDGRAFLPEFRDLALLLDCISGVRADAAAVDRRQDTVRVRIRDLAAFLENPMKARLARYFSLPGDWDDVEAGYAQDEPFSYDEMAIREMKTNWVRDIVAAHGDIEVSSRRLTDRGALLHAMSAAPAPLFRRMDESGLLDGLRGSFDKIGVPFPGREYVEHAVMGQDFAGDRAPGLLLPALNLTVPSRADDGSAVNVQISGSVDFTAPGSDMKPLEFAVVKANAGGGAFPAKMFVPLLFGLCNAARPDEGPRAFRALVFSIGGPLSMDVDVTRPDAMDYLTGLVADYLDDGALLENLPFGVVGDLLSDDFLSGALMDGDEPTHADVVDAIFEKFDDVRFGYHPSDAEKLLRDYASVPGNFRDVLSRRYRLPLACWNAGAARRKGAKS